MMWCWFHNKEHAPIDERCQIEWLTELLILALLKYLDDVSPTNATTIKGNLMSDYPLTASDSVVVSLTAADNVTGAAVAIDPGSVSVSLSNPGDTFSVDASGTFLTIFAGATLGTGFTVTVNGTVGGIVSDPWVGTYDVVAGTVTPDATTITGTFGTEVGPTSIVGAVPAAARLTNPNHQLLVDGQKVGNPGLVNGQDLGGRAAEA